MIWFLRNWCGEKKEGGEDEDIVSDLDVEYSGSEEEKFCDDKEENIMNIKGIDCGNIFLFILICWF